MSLWDKLMDIEVYTFSPGHFVFLALSMIFGITTIFIGKRLDKKGRKTMLIVLLILYLITDACKFIRYMVVPGYFSLQTSLPFHLCSTALFIYPFAVFCKNKTIRNFIYAANMPGAFFALVTPDIGHDKLFSFYYVHSVIAHTFIFFIPIFMIACGFFRPDIKQLPKVFLMLLIVTIPAVITNYLIDSNYFFLNGVVKGTFTEVLGNLAGEKLYVLPLIGMVFLAWILLYTPFAISDRIIKSKEGAGQIEA